MKVGELFVSIGLKVEGQDKADDVEKSLKRITAESGKVAAVVSAISAAFLVLANSAGQAAMAMKSFALDTGLGVSELQRWEYAAQANGVQANQLRGTILALQKQQAQIALGEGDISGFQFFGIDPRQNPFAVLTQLRQRIRQIGEDQIGIARERASALGISDEMFQFLRLSNPELEKQLELTTEEVAQLSKMQMAWLQVKLAIVAVGQKFISALAGPMEKFWKFLGGVITRFALFVDWLNKGSAAANIIKNILAAIVLIVGALTIVFVALTGALALATAAMFAFDLAASPVVLVIAAIAAALVLGTAQLLLYIALWDDLMVALEGGDAILTPIVKKWKEWADAIKHAYDTIKEFTGLGDKEKRQNFMASTSFVWDNLMKGPANDDMGRTATSGIPLAGLGGTTINNTPIEVNVDGSGDPRATGAAVVDSLKSAVSDASFQQPAATY